MSLHAEYVTGFSEGLGSFTYSRSGRQLALYYAVRAEPEVLAQIQAFFGGIGTIYRGAYLRVTRRDELPLIIEHFDAYPLRTKKKAAYEIWRRMVLAKQTFRAPDRDLLEDLARRLSDA